MRTNNLPSASSLVLTDEIIGNFNDATERATLAALLNFLSPNLIVSGTAAPTSSTEGTIYIQTSSGAINKVYGLVNGSWLEFP